MIYPGLPSDPGHALWKRDFTGASGLFAIVLKPVPHKAVAAMLDGLKLFGMGYSWGASKVSSSPSTRAPTARRPFGPSRVRRFACMLGLRMSTTSRPISKRALPASPRLPGKRQPAAVQRGNPPLPDLMARRDMEWTRIWPSVLRIFRSAQFAVTAGGVGGASDGEEAANSLRHHRLRQDRKGYVARRGAGAPARSHRNDHREGKSQTKGASLMVAFEKGRSTKWTTKHSTSLNCEQRSYRSRSNGPHLSLCTGNGSMRSP